MISVPNRGSVLADIELCLSRNRLYASGSFLEVIKKCLTSRVWGASVLYCALSIEAFLFDLLNSSESDIDALLTEAVNRKLITDEQKDDVKGIEQVKDAHAHPIEFLRADSRQRLLRIRDELGTKKSWSDEMREAVIEANRDLEWNAKMTSFLLEFYDEEFALRVAQKTVHLLNAVRKQSKVLADASASPP